MAHTLQAQSITKTRFFKPFAEFFEECSARRRCPAFTDEAFMQAGVQRCLGSHASGRDFLQALGDKEQCEVALNTFFESLKSPRRLKLCRQMLTAAARSMKRRLPDDLRVFRQLDDFEIFAGDGHFCQAASHDKKTGDSGQEGVKYPTGHIYTLDLRTQAMGHIDVADQITRKKEHEMRTLKRQQIEVLRRGAPPGRKVLYVRDPAGIDFRQWFEWKRLGIYFLSQEKANMKPETLGAYPFDAESKLNAGVLRDELIGLPAGVTLRRVTFQNPETGEIFLFITNLPASIPPGLVALLYKLRWDIEKLFDEVKNKLEEQKSWASTAVAKSIQANLIALTHNLLRLFEEQILLGHGIDNLPERQRKAETLQKAEDRALKAGRGAIPWPVKQVQRFTQVSVKFIRWLRNHLHLERPWDEALKRLAKIYATA